MTTPLLPSNQPVEEQQTHGLWTAIDRAQGIIRFDLEGNILHANQNFLRILGYRLDEIVGKHHSMLCEPSFAQSDDYRALWDNVRRGAISGGEFKRITKGGGAVWLQASYNPIINAAGKPVMVVKFATDITAVKLANAEFEGKVVAINRSTGVIEFDMQGNILFANELFLEALGYTAEEVTGRHHSLFCEPAYTRVIRYKNFVDVDMRISRLA